MLLKGSVDVILIPRVLAMDGGAHGRLSFKLNLSKAVETFAYNSDVYSISLLFRQLSFLRAGQMWSYFLSPVTILAEKFCKNVLLCCLRPHG